jgi:hypothetical protein
MSDLSPDERPQPPRARRATRPKAKAYTARRTQKPTASASGAESLAEPMPANTKASALSHAIETSLQEAASASESEGTETAGKRWWDIQVRGMPILSKEIALWASIVALGSLVVTLGPSVVLGVFNVSNQDLQNNSGLVQGWNCLSILLVYGLPVVGGWRATLRQGDWRQGGLTGFWSVILLEILLLLISAIYGAVTGQLAQFTTTDWGGFFVSLAIQLLVSFGLGAMGGYFSVWQRRREAQRQELLSSSS